MLIIVLAPTTINKNRIKEGHKFLQSKVCKEK